jgi:hypothetical protein
MITNISNSLRIFLADTTAISLVVLCLILIVWLFFVINSIKAKINRNEKRFASIEREIGGFSEKK